MSYYGYWNSSNIYIIVVSTLINYCLGYIILRFKDQTYRRLLLVLGLFFNIIVLGYFKYTNFAVANLNALGVIELDIDTIILPIGISFFIFQKIAYLVDCYKREVEERGFLSFCLFVMFFPQLIAGPIVHHREMMPQFARSAKRDWHDDLAVGLTVFAVGLFKKVVLADTMALGSTPVFDATAAGHAPTLIEAWVAGL